jgi:AcrR family transcriptional regulator
MDYDAFARSWDGHIRELIKINAKKSDAIENKHRQIVEGAAEVFIRKGYHPTSIREISDAAGMSMGQLYHYISTKDDVLFLICRYMQTTWYKHLTDRLVENPDDPVQTLVDAMHLTMEFHGTNKKLLQFIYSESKYLNKNHLQVVLQMDDKNVVQFWRDRLLAVQQKLNCNLDINASANMVLYFCVYLSLRGWNLKDRPISEHQELVVQFVLKALGLTPEQLNASSEPVS